MKNSHVNVTVDLKYYGMDKTYDLRIPKQITVKQLLIDIFDVLNIQTGHITPTTMKVATKGLVLADDDLLMDYPVTDGDLLAIL